MRWRWVRAGVVLTITATASIMVSSGETTGIVAAEAAPVQSRFVGVTPTRVLDTRPESRHNYTGIKPGPGSQTSVVVIGQADVPRDATAIIANLTVTDASAVGYVQAFPTGSGLQGRSSNINVERAGQTIANSVTVPIGENGSITLLSQSGTHLILDVAGYFVPVTGPVSSGRFISVDPTRIFDTRPGSAVNYVGGKPGPQSTTTVQITGRGPIPPTFDTPPLVPLAVRGVVLNVTAADATGPGFVQVVPRGAPIAETSNMNVERAGQTIANQVIVPVNDFYISKYGYVFPGSVQIYTEGGANLIIDVVGYFTGEASPAATQGLFTPVPPSRVLDTRQCCQTNYSGTTPNAGTIVTVDASGHAGLPTTAVAAVAANVTSVDAAAPGFVQAAATGSLIPGKSSVLNTDHAGQTVPNATMIPVNGDGQFDLFTEAGGHLLTDVFGYFSA